MGGTDWGEVGLLGSAGGDGSGAGPGALGEGAVVRGSLAVPTRAMCGDGPLAGRLLERAELARPPDPPASLRP